MVVSSISGALRGIPARMGGGKRIHAFGGRERRFPFRYALLRSELIFGQIIPGVLALACFRERTHFNKTL